MDQEALVERSETLKWICKTLIEDIELLNLHKQVLPLIEHYNLVVDAQPATLNSSQIKAILIHSKSLITFQNGDKRELDKTLEEIDAIR